MPDQIEQFATGTRAQPRAERVLATLLFTDIAGSTSRAAELEDERWSALLERHHGLVRRRLEHFRGREVKTRRQWVTGVLPPSTPEAHPKCADAG